MKKSLYGVAAFSIATAFVFAAPVIQKPLFGAETTPGKVEQNKVQKQAPISTHPPVKATPDALKNKGGMKSKTKMEDDPIGTRK